MTVQVKDANGNTLTIDTINDLLTALQSAGGRAYEQITDGTNSPAIKAASMAPRPPGLGAAAARAAAPRYTAPITTMPGPPPNAWTEAAKAPM